jgi:hypothetical protein
MIFLWTAISGWLATLLFGAGASIPYFVRAARPVTGPYLARLRPHYWLGFLIPAAAFLHAWLPMSAGRIRGFDQTDLLIATAALLAMLWQLALGIALRDAKGADRRKSRRLHFWTAALIAGLVAAHIVLNRT